MTGGNSQHSEQLLGHGNRVISISGRVVVRECKHCGEHFRQPLSWVKRNNFCSSACGKAFVVARGESRKRGCLRCGELFVPRQGQIDRDQGRYCSVKCALPEFTHSSNTTETKMKARETWEENNRLGKHRYKCGSDSSSWKGRWKGKDGYWRVSVPLGQPVLEQRYVMEKHLGRKLTGDEVVHHINEDKGDNRIDNLQVMTRAEHLIHHLHGDSVA